MRKRTGRPRKDPNEVREEALRPAPSLGYDRDTLARYLINRELHDIAEIQLRRAIWLNPYEPKFKEHLAWCLYKQRRYAEAREWIAQVCGQPPVSEEAVRLRVMLDAAK